MTEQMIVTEETYEEIKRYFNRFPQKDKGGSSITVTNIFGDPIYLMKIRLKNTDGDEYIQSMLQYWGVVYIIRTTEDKEGSFCILVDYLNDRNSFEFCPVKDVRSYKVSKAYDLIKMGLVNLRECSNMPGDVESIFDIVKGMEKDDTEDIGS